MLVHEKDTWLQQMVSMMLNYVRPISLDIWHVERCVFLASLA